MCVAEPAVGRRRMDDKEAGQMRLWGEGRSGHAIGARSGATIPE